MKTILITVLTLFAIPVLAQDKVDPEVLVGSWILDMSPQDPDDSNYAKMVINSVKDGEMKGTFYRDGVKMKNGNINTQTGVIYGALVSGDNSGSYNSTFYFKDNKLYGTTHAIDRDFLSVWTAVKQK